MALVTDGGKARILSMKRYPGEFQELLKIDSPTRHKSDRDLVSDASGRSHHVRGPVSHVRERRSNAHEQGEIRFVGKLLDRVAHVSASGMFESLVLVADPKTLGIIRRQMDRNLQQKVTLELNLDLTGLANLELEKRLRAALGWPAA